MTDLTKEQRNAIRCLKRLAKRWPKGLWIFARPDELNVMAEPPAGKDRHQPCGPYGGGSVRPELRIASVPIPCDAGDW